MSTFSFQEVLQKYKEKKILILGFGATGIALYKFFKQHKIHKVYIYDQKSKEELLKTMKNHSIILNDSNEKMFFLEGNIKNKTLKNMDYIFKSPGLANKLPIIQFIKHHKIPLLSELDLFYQLFTQIDFKLRPKIIGITGSNGKTTTVHLLGLILKNSSLKFLILGNIGTPVIHYYNYHKNLNLKEFDVLVLELSSFMLEDFNQFKVDIACVLNISPNHLDQHSSLANYIKAKIRIFKTQSTKSFSIMDKSNQYFERIQKLIKGKLISFSKTKHYKADISFWNLSFYKGAKKLFSIAHSRKHLILYYMENVLSVICIAKICLNLKTSIIKKAILSFKSLDYRFQKLGIIHKVLFINDSKSTTPKSVHHAIKQLRKDQKNVLILGGINKNLNFSFLKSIIFKKIKLVVLFGSSAQSIKNMLDGNYSIIIKNNLSEAFYFAYNFCKHEKSCILFSPGCASFDQYENYQERGKHFRKLFEDVSEKAKL